MELKKQVRTNHVYFLECHVNLDLEGFEEVDAEGEPTGIKFLTL